MPYRQEKIAGRLQEIISTFLGKQTSTQSIITVTHCEVNGNLKNVTAFLSIFPESFELEALDFAKRQRSELRSIIADQMPMKTIPFVEFAIDAGEKNRQKIDGLLEKI